MSIGIWQVVLVLLVVLIIFGAGKLPRVMGDLASGIKNFKKGMADDSADSAESVKSIPGEPGNTNAVNSSDPSANKDRAAQG